MSSIKHDVTVFNWSEASKGVIDAVVAEDSSLLMEKDLHRLVRLLGSPIRSAICYSFRSWNLVFGCVCAIGVAMTELIKPYMGFLAAMLKSRARLQAENLALRHQLCVYQ